MPRLFTGIELPEDVHDQLVDLQKPLPGARWVNADDLHITLRFFGDIEGRAVREVYEALDEVDADAFEIRLEGLGTFGGSEPRTLWAGVSSNPLLDILQRATDRAARVAGLPAEARAYKPHVTLARLKGTPPEILARYLGRIGAFRTEPFPVPRFVMFSSKPKVGGGPYVVEASYPLRGGWDEATDEEETHEKWRR